jgi:hypothetical protein
LVSAAEQVTDHELLVLFDGEWRCRLTASWLVATNLREQFREQIGQLLLASELTYAGEGYCIALARLGTSRDAELLTAYLDHFLRLPELRYDQDWAIGALQHIDARLGTAHALEFLRPRGLWHQWAKDDGDNAAAHKARTDQICSLLD